MEPKITNKLLESLMDSWFSSALFASKSKLGEYISKNTGINDPELIAAPNMETALDIVGKRYLVD